MSSPSKRPPVITDRDLETLVELEAATRSMKDHQHRGGWARPMDVGGHDGTHHSKTLQKLVAMGFAMSSRAPGRIDGWPNSRPGIGYKITDAGVERLARARISKRSSPR